MFIVVVADFINNGLRVSSYKIIPIIIPKKIKYLSTAASAISTTQKQNKAAKKAKTVSRIFVTQSEILKQYRNILKKSYPKARMTPAKIERKKSRH
ncbi:MAG: hypothetical protein RR806_01265 [Oscillospiraceae bacterium]